MRLRARDFCCLGARTAVLILLAASGVFQDRSVAAAAPHPASNARFEVSFPESAHSGAITGRVFVFISQKESPEPRLKQAVGETPRRSLDWTSMRWPQARQPFWMTARQDIPRAAFETFPPAITTFRRSSTSTPNFIAPMATPSGRTWTNGRGSVSIIRRGICIATCRESISTQRPVMTCT